MSKMSELEVCVSELRTAAQSLAAVVDNLAELFGNMEPDASAQRGNDNTQIGAVEVTTPEPKPVTLEQVRAVLADKSRCGHTAEVRELLERHGAAKLSEIAPAKYAALLADAKVLGDG